MNKQNFLTRMLLLVALIVGSVNGAWGDVTVSMTSFTNISGNVDNDKNVSYEAAKGTASTVPGVYSNEIRVYQNGGTFTVTGNDGSKIKSVTLGSSMATKVTYSIDGGTNSSEKNISANGTITVSDLNCTSIKFTCTGTDKYSRLYVNSLSVTYAPSTSVVKPTFSIEDGSSVVEGSTVTLSTTTEGAAIYYTLDGTEPTSSSTLYKTPIVINSTVTIKAIATKSGENSVVASASYTIKEIVRGYTIDFEKPIDAYVDWTTNNVGIHTSGVTSAHGGSAWGSNVSESDNGTATAIIQTKVKVAHPNVFTCYISKESNNTKASTWKIQVSSDETNWYDIAVLNKMTQDEWTEFSGDIKAKGYTDVYVRLYYEGSTAKRAVDDITLSEYDVVTVSQYFCQFFVHREPPFLSSVFYE